MKKLLPLIGLLALFLSTSVFAQEVIETAIRLDIYYFHGHRRCATCLAVEKETRALLRSDFKRELDTGVLKFTVLNLEEPESQSLVQKYGIWVSSLLLVNKQGQKVDLTGLGFRSARNKPERFREELRSIIQQQLSSENTNSPGANVDREATDANDSVPTK
jgi:hypothetical protein